MTEQVLFDEDLSVDFDENPRVVTGLSPLRRRKQKVYIPAVPGLASQEGSANSSTSLTANNKVNVRMTRKVSKKNDVSTQRKRMSNTEIASTIDTIYIFSDVNEIRCAIAVILDRMNDLLNDGQFDACSAILNQIDVERIKPPLMVSLLGVTLAAKNMLNTSRSRFYDKVLNKLTSDRSSEAACRLLAKYQ